MGVIPRKVGYDTASGADEDIGRVNRDAHRGVARARPHRRAIAGKRDLPYSWTKFRYERREGKRQRWAPHRRVNLRW